MYTQHKHIRCLLFFIGALFLCGAAWPSEFSPPPFARAAALADGVRLLQNKENFQLLRDLIPGIRAMKLAPEDLAHEYLIFTSEDLKVYGMTVRRKKGSLRKLYNAFLKNPNTIRLRYKKEEFLSALWVRACTSALWLPREKMLLQLLDRKAPLAGAAVIRLKQLPGAAPRKLLKEFPELKHLRHLRAQMAEKKEKSSLEFAFDNENAPKKFPFLNWGVSLLLWHKTDVFRAVYQETERKILRLSLYDPPVSAIARRLVPADPGKKVRRSSVINLRQLAAGIHIYLLDHDFRMPETLQELFDSYVTHPAVYIAPFDKKSRPASPGGRMKTENTSYLYLLRGVSYKDLKDPGAVPMLMESPQLLPRGRNRIAVAFADGHTARINIPGVYRMSSRQVLTELLKRSKKKIPPELQKTLLKTLSTPCRPIRSPRP